MLDDDAFIESYKRVVGAVHKFGTPVIAQLCHSGRQTRSKITGEKPVAPSAIKDKVFNEEVPEELTEGGIEKIINNFIAAIGRAKKAGFNGVQLHAAHGYLLSEFLSPYMNRRQDAWGGTVENRYRIVSEIISRARTSFGDYPVMVKVSSYEKNKRGITLDDTVEGIGILEKAGCAAVEISAGIVEDAFWIARSNKIPMDALLEYNFRFRNMPPLMRKMMKPLIGVMFSNPKPKRMYNVEAANTVKKNTSIPVIVVGGIRSLEEMAGIIGDEKADFVSMSRPFIIEPDLVKKLKDGTQFESKCVSCNYCAVVNEVKPTECRFAKQ
jgi:2,4-dienoyl-CoA reductase-like NADH-dependent reductase (Old Yellow Enzyme family)